MTKLTTSRILTLLILAASVQGPVVAEERYDLSFSELDRPLRESISIFVGLEGSKQPQDFGVNAHFGGRAAANWGVLLLEDAGVGFQIGTGVNATANAVQVNQRVAGNSSRTQLGTTLGFFQRTDLFEWGIGYDLVYQEYYDDFFLTQWRGQVGLRLNNRDTVGVRGTLDDRSDQGSFGNIDVRLQPISQGSVYWRHTLPNSAQFTFWVGAAEGHNEPNVALGDLPRQESVLVYGAELFVPLTPRVALFGEANFLTPADTGTVDAYLGVVVYPWARAKESRQLLSSPLLPVVSNTSMSVDLYR